MPVNFQGYETLENSRQRPTDGCILSSEVESSLHSPQQEKLYPSVFAIICFVDRHGHTSHGSCFII